MNAKNVEIRDSGRDVGLGMFALNTFESGEFIAEYTGKRITTKEADAMPENRYLFEVDADWTVDGSDTSNTARYINHSCEPNAEADIMDGVIVISALRTIEKGEEITIDYGIEYIKDFLLNACVCGAATCHSPRIEVVI